MPFWQRPAEIGEIISISSSTASLQSKRSPSSPIGAAAPPVSHCSPRATRAASAGSTGRRTIHKKEVDSSTAGHHLLPPAPCAAVGLVKWHATKLPTEQSLPIHAKIIGKCIFEGPEMQPPLLPPPRCCRQLNNSRLEAANVRSFGVKHKYQ